MQDWIWCRPFFSIPHIVEFTLTSAELPLFSDWIFMHLGPLCFSSGNFFGNLEQVHLLVQKNFAKVIVWHQRIALLMYRFSAILAHSPMIFGIELLSFWHQRWLLLFLGIIKWLGHPKCQWVDLNFAKKLAKLWLGHPKWQWVNLLLWNASLVCFYITNTWTPRASVAVHVANNGQMNTQIFLIFFA